MSKRRTNEVNSINRDPRGSAVERERSATVVLPRAWLVGLGVLVLVPWIVAGTLYVAGPSRTAVGSALDDAEATPPASALGDPKAWGQLTTTSIVISPPAEYVPTNWGPVASPVWRFPGTTSPELEAFLASAGLAREDVARLVSSARPDPRMNGVVVTPTSELVNKLDPVVRANIYLVLAQSPLNPRQRDAYRYFGASTADWLGHSSLAPATVQLVDRYIYKHREFLYFADIDAVRPQIADPAELQRLAKALLRESTLLLSVRIGEGSRVEPATEYWGRGGRRTDIRPLLESVAASDSDHAIDVSHLLPAFARQHLYRYPKISLADLEKPLVNCFWTALNFFNTEPDDRFLDDAVAIDRLKRDYYIVHDDLQFGDIVAFEDRDGSYFHAAVYLADGLVFGKNGNSPLAPWTIVPVDRLKGYYVEHADDWRPVYYRRKDL